MKLASPRTLNHCRAVVWETPASAPRLRRLSSWPIRPAQSRTNLRKPDILQLPPSDDHVVARLLYAPRAVLAVVVNETAVDARRRLTIGGWAVEVPVASGRSRLVLFERATGKVIASTSGEEVLVE